MNFRKIIAEGSTAIASTADRRWLGVVLCVGLLLSGTLVGAVGLTAATGGDFFSGAKDEPARAGGVAVTADTTDNDTTSNASAFPHEGPEPLPALATATEDPGVSTTSQNVTSRAIEAHLQERINEIRAARGLDPIAFSPALSTHARAHSEDMDDRDYFAHENPDGETAADRIPNAFQHCSMVGENLHYRTWRMADAATIANATVEGWMDSSGHRENLLRENWTVQGLGVYVGTGDRRAIVYSTQKFCAAR